MLSSERLLNGQAQGQGQGFVQSGEGGGAREVSPCREGCPGGGQEGP